MIERHDIESYFTELSLIQDKDLRKKVVDVWKIAADRGGWKKLQEIPFTLLFEGSGLLVDHTKRITKIAWNVVNVEKNPLTKTF